MLKDKNILLIGASGGIGRSLNDLIDQLGGNAIATSRSDKNYEFFLDLRSETSIANLARMFIEKKIKLDGIVNCSGVHHSGPLSSMGAEEINEQLQTNLLGNIFLLKYLLPIFISQRSGSIVLMSSVSAHRMTRGHAAYSASKAGLEGLVKASASEVAKRNVRINAVMPGPVLTPMLQKSIEENGVNPQDLVPMGRLIKPDEIAQACAFLLSDKASAITGVSLPVDGGYVLW